MTSSARPDLASLSSLAAAVGVDVRYLGWRGQPVAASPEALAAVLTALGHDVRNPDEARAAVEAGRWRERVPPVIVAWDGGPVRVPARVPADVDAAWRLTLATEGGAEAEASGRLFAAPARDHAWPAALGGAVHCVRELTIAIPERALGYHRLRWELGGEHGEALVIAAPVAAWGAPGTVPRRWGVFAPLYAVRTATSGHTGDLGVLRALLDAVARRGGHYVATLPLLAGFLDEPCQPSPYAPASRLYWNELYAEVDGAVPAPAAGALVDYRAQYAARRQLLEAAARAAWADPRERGELEAAATGALLDYAMFRALGERARAPWSCWSADEQARAAPTALAAIEPGLRPSVEFHVWAQRAMSAQLAAIKQAAGVGGGLYLDLPVGVNGDAYEVWRHRERFLTSLAAGAPPDALFLGGQDWGLPPLHPERERAAGYGYVRACLATHMRHARMLRIDHVMGLYRLYCVPRGLAASDGAYVRYRADELYALVTLESHRHQCAVAGEDLGTVPPEVRPALRQHGIARLYVGQFAMPSRAGQEMAPPEADQVASLNTHDMPTFAGWWRGVDLDDQRDLGLIDDAQRAKGGLARAASRAALLGADDPSDVGAARAMADCTRRLAASAAHLALITVEDLWLEPRTQNVPGTTDERPNWRRPWSRSLDEVLADPEVDRALAAVATAREGG